MLNFKLNQNISDDDILQMEVSSPHALKNLIADRLAQKQGTGKFINLIFNDAKFFVRAFQFKDTPVRQAHDLIQYESVELVGMPMEEVAFDYQVLEASAKTVNGVLMCMDKNLLEQYFTVADEAGLAILSISGYPLVSMNAFFQQKGLDRENKHLCILDFSKEEKLYITVFDGRQCALIRILPFHNIRQIMAEIIQSFRSVCAQSSNKKFDQIYVCGNVLDGPHAGIKEHLERAFDTPIEFIGDMDMTAVASSQKKLFTMNLAKNYSLSLPSRRILLAGANIVLAAALLLSCVLGLRILIRGVGIGKAAAAFSQEQYKQARGLKQQVDSKNAKK